MTPKTPNETVNKLDSCVLLYSYIISIQQDRQRVQLGVHYKQTSDVQNTLKRINEVKLKGLVEGGKISMLGQKILRPLIKQSLNNQTKV